MKGEGVLWLVSQMLDQIIVVAAAGLHTEKKSLNIKNPYLWICG